MSAFVSFVFAMAGLAAFFATMLNWLMPIRLAFASLRGGQKTFLERQLQTPSRAFRFHFGLYFIAIEVLLVLIVVSVAFGGVQNVRIGMGDALMRIALIWWPILGFAVPALSYVYEFYFEGRASRLLSFAYLNLVFWSITFPYAVAVVVYLSLAAGMPSYYDVPDYAAAWSQYYGQFFYSTADAPTLCGATLHNLGFETGGVTFEEGTFSGTVGFWTDEYLDAFSFGVLDAFGCKVSPVHHNESNLYMSTLVSLFRLFVSAFAVGVFWLPIQKLVNAFTARVTSA